MIWFYFYAFPIVVLLLFVAMGIAIRALAERNESLIAELEASRREACKLATGNFILKSTNELSMRTITLLETQRDAWKRRAEKGDEALS